MAKTRKEHQKAEPAREDIMGYVPTPQELPDAMKGHEPDAYLAGIMRKVHEDEPRPKRTSRIQRQVEWLRAKLAEVYGVAIASRKEGDTWNFDATSPTGVALGTVYVVAAGQSIVQDKDMLFLPGDGIFSRWEWEEDIRAKIEDEFRAKF